MLLLASLRSFRHYFTRAKCVFGGITCRNLTVNQVATALRPFYFQVHPDLFGQYPKERAVNEESLKLLSQHLANLQSTQRKVEPVTLTFYAKQQDLTQNNEDEFSHIKSIQIPLTSASIKDSIRTILHSCNLSCDYVSSIKEPDKKAQPDRPIRWHPSFYTHYGIRNPFAQEETQKPRVKMQPCFSIWCQKSAQKAREKIVSQEPIRQENERLKKLLKEETGVLDVRWECGWSITQYRACLKGFLRLYKQNKVDLGQIKGHNLVFGNQTGICIRGDVILRKDDVPDHWLPLLLSTHKHDVILNKLPSSENFLSTLLGGIKVVRPGSRSIILAEAYLMQLRRMINSIKEYLENNPDVSVVGPLNDLELVIESATGPTTISPAGKIIVPSSSPGFLVINFINKNAGKARQVQAEYLEDLSMESDVVETCREKLGLRELTRESSVTMRQMQTCCNRLLDGYLTRLLDIDLEGCVLKVDTFYSVMSDGEMHIPWNWEDQNFDWINQR